MADLHEKRTTCNKKGKKCEVYSCYVGRFYIWWKRRDSVMRVAINYNKIVIFSSKFYHQISVCCLIKYCFFVFVAFSSLSHSLFKRKTLSVTSYFTPFSFVSICTFQYVHCPDSIFFIFIKYLFSCVLSFPLLFLFWSSGFEYRDIVLSSTPFTIFLGTARVPHDFHCWPNFY